MKTKSKRRPTTSRIGASLTELLRAELVRVSDEAAEGTAERAYTFRHTLIQETALATLLRNQSRRLHRLVAHALEKVNANRLDEYAAELAEHFAEAEDDAKTLEYSTRAGDIAARVFANGEALTHYARAIEIGKRGHATSAQLIHLYKQRGRILEVIGKYYEAVESYCELHELAATRHDRTLELAYLTLRAPLHSAPMPTFDADLAKQLLLDALGTARELGDEPAEARILWNLTLLSVHTMRPADGLIYGEPSLALSEKLNLREQMAYTLHDLFIPYRATGQIARAREVQAQARALFREMDNKSMLADNLGMSAQFAMYEGDLDRALEFGTEGLEVSRTVGNPFGIYFNQSFLAGTYLERGDFAGVLGAFGEQIALIKHGDFSLNGAWVTVVLAWFYGYIGAFAQSQEMERLARDPRWEPIPPVFRSGLFAYRARIRLLSGDVETARRDIAEGGSGMELQSAIQPGAVQMPLAQAELALCQQDFGRALQVLREQAEWAAENEYRLVLTENFYLEGRARMGLGEWDAAAEALQRAREHGEAMGTRRILWQILAALSDVEGVRGKRDEAEGLRAQARTVLDYIVAHTPEEFRGGFLNLPQVRTLREERA